MPTPARQNVTTDTDASGRDAAEKVTAAAKATTKETAAETSAAASGAADSMRTVLTAPVTVVRAVADDVVTTVRRPDAVLYLGGLVGLGALGVLEWPVVAAVGAGVAVANGVRRARA